MPERPVRDRPRERQREAEPERRIERAAHDVRIDREVPDAASRASPRRAASAAASAAPAARHGPGEPRERQHEQREHDAARDERARGLHVAVAEPRGSRARSSTARARGRSKPASARAHRRRAPSKRADQRRRSAMLAPISDAEQRAANTGCPAGPRRSWQRSRTRMREIGRMGIRVGSCRHRAVARRGAGRALRVRIERGCARGCSRVAIRHRRIRRAARRGCA